MVATTEVARADNENLARASFLMTRGLAEMDDHGWIDRQTALELAMKFAGEHFSEEEIAAILAGATPPEPEEDPQDET